MKYNGTCMKMPQCITRFDNLKFDLKVGKVCFCLNFRTLNSQLPDPIAVVPNLPDIASL